MSIDGITNEAFSVRFRRIVALPVTRSSHISPDDYFTAPRSITISLGSYRTTSGAIQKPLN